MSPVTIKNYTTPEAHELGVSIARFADEAEPKARLKMPQIPPRCASCAFREGPHLANGSPATLLDAIKAAVEMTPFMCHDHRRKDWPCSGWLMIVLAEDEPVPVKVPWDFFGSED